MAMSIEHQGMLLILNDVDPHAEAEFNLWYDTEHMLERVSIHGFLRASRYRGSTNSVRKYCALYRTTDLGVFESPAYRRALSLQSAWSKRILKVFVDPHRAVGKITANVGIGRGNHLTLAKLPSAPLREAERANWSDVILPAIGNMPHVVSAYLFETAPHLSGPVAEYRPTTRPLATPDDCILILESSGQEAISWTALQATIGDLAHGCNHIGNFAFAWGLDQSDISSAAHKNTDQALR
jgi:hypothetical protein